MTNQKVISGLTELNTHLEECNKRIDLPAHYKARSKGTVEISFVHIKTGKEVSIEISKRKVGATTKLYMKLDGNKFEPDDITIYSCDYIYNSFAENLSCREYKEGDDLMEFVKKVYNDMLGYEKPALRDAIDNCRNTLSAAMSVSTHH